LVRWATGDSGGKQRGKRPSGSKSRRGKAAGSAITPGVPRGGVLGGAGSYPGRRP